MAIHPPKRRVQYIPQQSNFNVILTLYGSNFREFSCKLQANVHESF